jgi:coenzyme PQQ synthesis protein D (PqqD)
VDRVRIPEYVTWHDAGVDLVLFNHRDGTYHALDRAGSEVWRALGRDRPIAAVVALLRERYPQSAATIDADVRAFVSDAVRLGLIVISAP